MSITQFLAFKTQCFDMPELEYTCSTNIVPHSSQYIASNISSILDLYGFIYPWLGSVIRRKLWWRRLPWNPERRKLNLSITVAWMWIKSSIHDPVDVQQVVDRFPFGQSGFTFVIHIQIKLEYCLEQCFSTFWASSPCKRLILK